MLFRSRENHASIYAGCQMSYGKMLRYRHSDMEDLEKQLRRVPEQNGALKMCIRDRMGGRGGPCGRPAHRTSCKPPDIAKPVTDVTGCSNPFPFGFVQGYYGCLLYTSRCV